MYDPVGDFLIVIIIVVGFVGLMAIIIGAANSDEKHDKQMREQFSQCQKDHKEWVLTGDNGLDGICVTKK